MSSHNRAAMINRLYRWDRMVIIGFILLMWSIMSIVLFQVVFLLQKSIVKIIAVSSAVTVGIFCTASLVAVLVHLKQKRVVVYGEDVHNLFILKGMSEYEEMGLVSVDTEPLAELEG